MKHVKEALQGVQVGDWFVAYAEDRDQNCADIYERMDDEKHPYTRIAEMGWGQLERSTSIARAHNMSRRGWKVTT